MPDPIKTRVESLTRRQLQLLRLISLGCTNAEMAAILGLSPNTIDNHRARLMASLQCDKAQLLARIAIKYRVSSMKDQLTLSEKRKSGRKRDNFHQFNS